MSSVILVALEQAALLLLISLCRELNLIIKNKELFDLLGCFSYRNTIILISVLIMTCKKS